MTTAADDSASLIAQAKRLRRAVLEMIAAVGTGHPGSSLSMVEILTVLYYAVLRHRPGEPEWPLRDRFLLSKGHGAPALYATLIDLGVLALETATLLRQLGSPLQGHPDRRFTPGLEISAGSLGQGLSMGLGMALAARRLEQTWRVYVLLGDGECQEGQVWEAAMAAGHHRLHRLCAIVDCNGFQHDGAVEDILDLEPLAAKWRAFGWRTVEVDGHDCAVLARTLRTVGEGERPVAVLARTVKGKGVAFMEGRSDWHSVADADQLARYVEELGRA
ncbi:MAG: transketolase [Acidobacteriota bacterium]